MISFVNMLSGVIIYCFFFMFVFNLTLKKHIDYTDKNKNNYNNHLYQFSDSFDIDTKFNIIEPYVKYTENKILNDEKCTVSYTVKTLDFDDIKSTVGNNVELLQLNALEDIIVMLNLLKELQYKLAINKFDKIYIYRYGYCLLKIVNPDKNTGYSVSISTNDYKRQLLNLYNSNK